MALDGFMISGRPEPTALDLERRLEKQVTAITRATRIIVIGGVLAAAVSAIGLHFVIGQLGQAVAEPKLLAVAVRQRVEREMPQTMANLEKTLKQNAPKIVADTRAKLFQQLPVLRDKVAKRLADYLVSKISPPLEKELRKLIQKITERGETALAPAEEPSEPLDRELIAAELRKLIRQTLDDSAAMEAAGS